MKHYFFSYDVNTKRNPCTQGDDIHKAMCDLKNQGFEVRKLDIASAYRLSHKGFQYKFINDYVAKILHSTDRRIVVKIEESNGSDGVLNLWISDKGTVIKCD